MNGFTFSPALGWVAGGLLAAGLAVLAILEIVLFVRRRASSDETAWACIRRTLMLLIVAVMVLTPSVVSSTTSQAINATDVIVAVENTVADIPDMRLNSFVTVADAGKVKVYMKNFGEFYNNQIESAGTIILSRTQKLTQEKLEAAVALLREKNPTAAILTTPWDQLNGQAILAAVEKVSLADELLEKMRAEHEAEEAEHHHHHHEHDDDDGHDEHEHHHHHDHDDEDGHEHCCHHHHEDEEHEHCHHHEHDHDEEHEHHHHHHGDGECDDPECSCHHHHHHADEVFTSWGAETPKQFTQADIDRILTALDSGEYGAILRAKGIVPAADGQWLHFDYVPQEHEVRYGAADYTGRLCVIGSQLKEDGLKTLFGL